MVSIGSMDEGLAVLERERRDERREGGREGEEGILNKRKKEWRRFLNPHSEHLVLVLSRNGGDRNGKEAHHLSTFLLSFVRTRSNTDSRDFFLNPLKYKPNYYA